LAKKLKSDGRGITVQQFLDNLDLVKPKAWEKLRKSLE